MNEIKFRKLVQEMMDAQKKYFKTRTVTDLMEAKRLEALVRAELAAGPDPKPDERPIPPAGQPELLG